MFATKNNMYKEMQNQADIQKCSKVELVILIYDKIIYHIDVASKAIAENKLDVKIANINKALNIIEVGLLAYLDMSAGEVSKNLKEFYLSSIATLIKGNINNDPKDLHLVADNFNNIKTAWRQIA